MPGRNIRDPRLLPDVEVIKRIDSMGLPEFDSLGVKRYSDDREADINRIMDIDEARRLMRKLDKAWPSNMPPNPHPGSGLDPGEFERYELEAAKNILHQKLNASRGKVRMQYPHLAYKDEDLLGLNTTTPHTKKQDADLLTMSSREEEMKGLFDSPKAGKRRRSKKRVTKKRRNVKKTIKRKH